MLVIFSLLLVLVSSKESEKRPCAPDSSISLLALLLFESPSLFPPLYPFLFFYCPPWSTTSITILTDISYLPGVGSCVPCLLPLLPVLYSRVPAALACSGFVVPSTSPAQVSPLLLFSLPSSFSSDRPSLPFESLSFLLPTLTYFTRLSLKFYCHTFAEA